MAQQSVYSSDALPLLQSRHQVLQPTKNASSCYQIAKRVSNSLYHRDIWILVRLHVQILCHHHGAPKLQVSNGICLVHTHEGHGTLLEEPFC